MSTLQMPDQNPPPCSLSPGNDGLYFRGDVLTYRVTGLNPYNLDRLRINLKAYIEDQPAHFQIDTLDLYYSRARETFAENCVKYLKVKQDTLLAELSLLISALEGERVSMRERGNSSQPVQMSEEEKNEALEVLKSKDLLKMIVEDFDAVGYIGEKTNKLLCYIASVSRLQSDPLAVLVLSRSGAGKTGLQEAVCKFVPPESVIQYTRITGQALFYRDENALKHKVLAVEEDEGMQPAMYSVKTLISSQKLSVSATRTDAKTGKFSVDEYTVHGPVVVMVSTTNPNGLDDETKQRFLILTIDETPEQTKSILQAQITKNSHSWYTMSSDEAGICKLHHNMQRLLKPLTVTFPDGLRFTWPFARLQMRREQKKFISLVKAIALLHQYQRKTGTLRRADGVKVEYVQATQRDIDLALDLGRLVFSRNVDDVSPTGRRLLAEILKLVTFKQAQMKELDGGKDLFLFEIPFTRKELRQEIGWSETQVRQNIEPLVELGYLGKLAGRQGSACRYVLLDDGSKDPEIDLEGNVKNGAEVENQRLSRESSQVRTGFALTSHIT